MKIKMILIGLSLLLWINSGLAGAATLDRTRVGDHKGFTRVVFEFNNLTQFMEPVIKKEGKLSVVFPNTTTLLPNRIRYGTTTRVEAIQLHQRDWNLAANIALAIRDFKVKSYFLPNPERFVIDIYWMRPPPIDEAPPPKIAVPEKTVEVERPEPVIKSIKGIVKGSAIQPIDRASIFSSSYGFLQTFFLAGLNLFTLVIIVLLSLILSRQIRVIDSAHLEYVPEPKREPDDPITTIDKRIEQRLNGMINPGEWR